MTKAKKTPARTATKTAVPKAAADSTKLAKTGLVDLMAERTTLTKQQSAAAFDAAMECIVSAVQSGQTVGLPGLGTFSVKETAARTGVRPGTSDKIQIPAGKKVAFKVASTLKGSF